MALEAPDGGPVKNAHRPLQDAHELRASERPIVPQHFVVNVLNANSGEPAHDIQGIQQFLQVEQIDLPRQTLFADGFCKRGGGRAMPASRIEIDQNDPRHGLRLCHAAALIR